MVFANRQVRHAFLRRVLALLALQLLLTAAVAAPLTGHKRVRRFLHANPWVLGLAVIATTTVLLLMAWSEAARRRHPTNLLLLGLFTASDGALLGAAGATYSSQALLLGVLISAAAALALVGYAGQTAWDFSPSGGVLFAAAVVLAVVAAANAALGVNTLQLLTGGCAALLFSAWAAYDVALLAAGESWARVSADEAVFGVCGVYTDVVALGMTVLGTLLTAHGDDDSAAPRAGDCDGAGGAAGVGALAAPTPKPAAASSPPAKPAQPAAAAKPASPAKPAQQPAVAAKPAPPAKPAKQPAAAAKPAPPAKPAQQPAVAAKPAPPAEPRGGAPQQQLEPALEPAQPPVATLAPKPRTPQPAAPQPAAPRAAAAPPLGPPRAFVPATKSRSQAVAILAGVPSLRAGGRSSVQSWRDPAQMCRKWWGITCNGAGLATEIKVCVAPPPQLQPPRAPLVCVRRAAPARPSSRAAPAPSAARRLPPAPQAQNSNLPGTLPAEWAALSPSLALVSLSSSSLTGSLPREWAVLSRLYTARLDGNALTGPLPASWGGMAALSSLNLGCNALTGPLPPSWARLGSLAELYLGDNALSGTLPASWAGLGSLYYLELHGNALTGSLPPGWGGMPSLRFVSLHDNPRLAGCVPDAWRGRVKFQAAGGEYAFTPDLGAPGVLANTSLTGWCPPARAGPALGAASALEGRASDAGDGR
ncbi:hypothetical protein HT031_003534 [Scenedesmus sp. PABB004]|nr:hypothetical protein HT031_003534 [Scenedesmus sp. PABB004]